MPTPPCPVADSPLRDIDPGYARFDLPRHHGSGWTDLHRIAHGITLARGQYDFSGTFEDHYVQPPECLTIKIMVAGELHLQVPEQRKPTVYRGAGVMLRQASEQQTFNREMVGHFSGVSIEVPTPLLEQLFEDQAETIGGPDGTELLLDSDHLCHTLGMATASTLLTSAMHTTVGRLHAEAAALQMLAQLIDHKPWRQGPQLPLRQRVAVQDARDILHDEFAHSHSIASLARRVGINECYLKSAFKAATGQTIAQYLRGVRMQQARALLEAGQCSVLQACEFVGYSNPGQFAAAFRRIHGVTPASVKGLKDCP